MCLSTVDASRPAGACLDQISNTALMKGWSSARSICSKLGGIRLMRFKWRMNVSLVNDHSLMKNTFECCAMLTRYERLRRCGNANSVLQQTHEMQRKPRLFMTTKIFFQSPWSFSKSSSEFKDTPLAAICVDELHCPPKSLARLSGALVVF